MKLLTRFFHWIVCAFVPAVLAACYGAPYDPDAGPPPANDNDTTDTTNTSGVDYQGIVKDSADEGGLVGIQLTCVNPVSDAVVLSGDGGLFTIHSPTTCSYLLVEDIDGEDNGGEFAPHTANLDGTNNLDLRIELERN